MTNNNTIIAGVMRWGKWGANFSKQQYQTTIAHCITKNITSFDHADIYGNYTTEQEFGTALHNMKIERESIKLITKCGIQMLSDVKPNHSIKSYNTTKQYIINQVEQSLINLKTSYINTLLIHRPSPLMQEQEIAEAFTQLKNSGKVLNFGVSNFNYLQVAALKNVFEAINYNQIELSYAHNNFLNNGEAQYYKANGIQIMAYSPLYNLANITATQTESLIIIANKYNATIAQILYAWLWHIPQQIQVVIGTSQLSRISEAVAAQNLILNHDDWFAVLKIGVGKDVA